MRLSQWLTKPIIDQASGQVIGTFAKGEMHVDPQTGVIMKMTMPKRGEDVHFKWSDIVTIGHDYIIVTLRT